MRADLLKATSRKRTRLDSYATIVRGDGPLHYWRFAETAGAACTDIGSAPVNATAVAGFTRNEASLVPSDPTAAIKYTPGHATAGTAARFSGNSNFSFECWFRVDSFTSSANPVLFFTGRFNNAGWYCQVINTVVPGSPYIQFTTSQPGSINTESAAGSVTEGDIYHLVCVRNGTSVRIYLNGVETGYRTQGTHGSITAAVDTTHIGSYWDSAPSNRLVGAIDDVAVYNYALSADQVKAHYRAGSRLLGVDPYYDNVSLVANFTQSAHDARGKAATKFSNPLISGGKIFFNGSSQYVSYLDSADFAFGSGNFTIEARVTLGAGTIAADNFYTLLHQNNGVQTQNSLYMYFESRVAGSNRGWSCKWFDGAGAVVVGLEEAANAASEYTEGTEYHIAVVRNGSSFKLYRNGVEKASATYAGALVDSTSAFYVGRDFPSSGYFNGSVNAVRITKGIARYTAPFTPPQGEFTTFDEYGTDPYWNSVVLMAPFDGPNNSNTITDLSITPHTITSQGAVVSTAQSKFGGASLSFSGTSQHANAPASADWNLGSGDFTIEGWIYMTSSAVSFYRPIVVCDNIGVARGWLLLGDKDVSGKLVIAMWSDNSTSKSIASINPLSINGWQHVAATRVGNTAYLFVSGALQGTVDVTGFTIQDANAPLAIGTLWISGAAHVDTSARFAGYMDSMRVTKGVGRYTTTFTPPPIPFPES